jgi:uncharacterized protein
MTNPDDYTITADVAQRLRHYVYIYVDPRNGEVFYVGKGIGDRAIAHLAERGETRKLRQIAEIRAAGAEPRIEIIAHNLRDEEEAFRVEAALIELIGTTRLTNEVRGWNSIACARKPLRDFIMECAPRTIEITEPSLLIRINRLFRYGMSERELYEATRGVWKIGPRRARAKYAMAVFAGVVRQVYLIQRWHQAGTTSYETRDQSQLRQAGRWEFEGETADETIRTAYVGGAVEQDKDSRTRSSAFC